MMKFKSGNIRTISEEANVSMMTVSRVLRNSGSVSEKTRKKVLAAAAKYRYLPNALARGLYNKRSLTIGVILPLYDEFHTRMLTGIHDTLRAQDYSFLLLDSKDYPTKDESFAASLRDIHRLVERRVDGIILRPVKDDVSDLYFREIIDRNIPLVTVDRFLPNVTCDFSGTDDEKGGRMAADILAEYRDRALLHVSGPLTVSTARLRRKGLRDRLKELGRLSELSEIENTQYEASRVNVIREFLGSVRSPMAVFAGSDRLAAAVYKACRELRLKIPKDVAVIGFGNLTVSEILRPTLSTFDQKSEQIGMSASELVLRRISEERDNSKPRTKLTEPAFIRRQSLPSKS